MFSLGCMSSNKIAEHIIINVMCRKEDFGNSSVTGEVEKNIMSLNLPRTLEESIKKLVEEIRFEIELYYFYMLVCGVEFKPIAVKKLIFTMEGKIDYKLSTRKLVLEKKLDIEIRAVLACKFCFEEEVLAFWKIQPDILRKLAEQERLTTLRNWLKYLETEELPEQFLWKDFVLLKSAFHAAVDEINLEAADYFLKKMVAIPINERIDILQTARASISSAQSPLHCMSVFIDRVELFLADSQLKEYKLNVEKEKRKMEMYKMFINNKNMLIKNGNMLKNKYKLLINKVEMWKNENKGWNNEFATLANEYEILVKEYDALINENEKIRNEEKVFVKERN